MCSRESSTQDHNNLSVTEISRGVSQSGLFLRPIARSDGNVFVRNYVAGTTVRISVQVGTSFSHLLTASCRMRLRAIPRSLSTRPHRYFTPCFTSSPRTMTTLSKCCVSGHVHQGEPKGTVEKYAGLDIYITGTNTSQSIVIITVNGALDGVADELDATTADAFLISGYLWNASTGVLGKTSSSLGSSR